MDNRFLRSAGISSAVFAVTMIGLGLVGIFSHRIMPVWNPVPGAGGTHEFLVDLAIAISMICGIGLLIKGTAAFAARVLLAAFLFWMLVFRLPNLFRLPPFDACWSIFPLALMLAAAMVVYTWVADAWDAKHLRALSDRAGLRTAQVVYGLTLIFFGSAHFIDVKDTLSLIPAWMPFHPFWAYFTGSTYIAAGLAMVFGPCARLAAALAAVQIGSFLVLVWIPIVMKGGTVLFQWSETFLNAALLAGAWVMAASYGDRARPIQNPAA